MSDHELLAALDRAIKADPTDAAAFARAQRVRARAGLAPLVWCPACNGRLATVEVAGYPNDEGEGTRAELLCEACAPHESDPDECCATGCSSPAELPLGLCREHAWQSST